MTNEYTSDWKTCFADLMRPTRVETVTKVEGNNITLTNSNPFRDGEAIAFVAYGQPTYRAVVHEVNCLMASLTINESDAPTPQHLVNRLAVHPCVLEQPKEGKNETAA